MTWKEMMKERNGYDCITTFWEDFAIADRFGVSAIQDTFNRSFRDYKSNFKYMIELILVLNHRHWLYGLEGPNQNLEIAEVYECLYYKADNYVLENYTSPEETEYYFEVLD